MDCSNLVIPVMEPVFDLHVAIFYAYEYPVM